LEPGGRVFLMTFSDEEPGTEGPRRVSRQELYDAFAGGWEVESLQPVRFEVNPEFTEVPFSEGGPKAWLAGVRRKGGGRRGGCRRTSTSSPAGSSGPGGSCSRR